jgi:hypothetical protein
MWHHIDVYPTFDVWGYSVTSDRHRSGFTALENVTPTGFRCSVREWLWGGQMMPSVSLKIVTDRIYSRNARYQVTDVNLRTRSVRIEDENADDEGRLHLELNGDLHEIGIVPSRSKLPLLTLAGFSIPNAGWAIASKETRLQLRLLNKGSGAATGVTGTLSSTNPGVRIGTSRVTWSRIAPGEILEVATPFVFQVEDATREVAKFELTLEDDRKQTWGFPFEVRLFPEVQLFENVQIADGRSLRVQTHGDQLEEKSLGIGNGDGVVNPGESIQILVKDQNEFRLTSLYTTDPWVNVSGLNIRYSDYWGNYDHVGGSAKYSMPTISAACPAGHEIVFFAEYWLPNAPEHILKRGLVKLKVKGRDLVAPKPRWAEISPCNLLEVQIIEGGVVKEVKAKLSQAQNPSFVVAIELNDQGRDGDRSAGDAIFSGTLQNPPEGEYQLLVEAADDSGNQGSESLKLQKK